MIEEVRLSTIYGNIYIMRLQIYHIKNTINSFIFVFFS